MEYNISGILEDLSYYTEQLDVVGGVLVDLVQSKRKHAALLSEASKTYQLLTLDIIEIYNALKRAYRNSYSIGSKAGGAPLEILENAFVRLRDAAERAEVKAVKLSRHRGREAKIARATAQALSSLAENAARVLVSEAHKLDRWTVEWERELGLRVWLR